MNFKKIGRLIENSRCFESFWLLRRVLPFGPWLCSFWFFGCSGFVAFWLLFGFLLALFLMFSTFVRAVGLISGFSGLVVSWVLFCCLLSSRFCGLLDFWVPRLYCAPPWGHSNRTLVSIQTHASCVTHCIFFIDINTEIFEVLVLLLLVPLSLLLLLLLLLPYTSINIL